jgi:glycosyltransferase involved in cell wall biosynthesis
MHVLVFLTFDMSLKKWDENGTLVRELLLHKQMVRKGHSITMLTYGTKDDFRYAQYLNGIKPIPVYAYVGRPSSRVLRLMKSLMLPFRFGDIFVEADMYKTNQMYGAWIPVLAKMLFRKKLIIRCGYEYLHDSMYNARSIVKKMLRFIPRYLLEFLAYRAANTIVVTSAFSKHYIRKMFWVSDRRIQIQPNYVDTDAFRHARRRLRAIQSGNIAFVGRLHPVKNLFALLDALAGTHHRLSIVGKGPQEIVLKEHAAKKKVNVRFLGTCPHGVLPRVLSEMDLFVLPSVYENNPKALLEAMACGLPVVASDIPGIREIVKHEQNGLLCEPSAHALREAIDRLIHDPEVRRKLGRNARKTIELNFSIDKIMAQEIMLYTQMKAWIP